MSARKRSQAKGIQQRQVKRAAFPSDEESVALRQAGAEREAARVTRIDGAANSAYFGAFEVASKQWEQPYRVEIRSLDQPINTCSCQDHRMNGLGTCKHVERVLQYLARRRKRVFQAAAKTGPDTYEVFFDSRNQPPRLCLMRPKRRDKQLDQQLDAWFDDEGAPRGETLSVWRAIETLRDSLAPRKRRALNSSHHAAYWIRREERAATLRLLKQRFDADVDAGKRSDNPVLLPLYPYQKQGMRHLAFNGRALLADDMGLGKTAQAIAAAELLRQAGHVKRVLVVSPASLKAEWEEQIEKFAGIRAHCVYGLRPARLQAYAQEHAYTLCNYEQVRNDVQDINRLLVPDLVVLDEAQRIKNWPTRTAKTMKLLESPFAFVLTGTPLENRIEELYSLVEFVDPHCFGSLFRFQREYMDISPDNEIRPRNLDRLHRVVSRVMLRRRKGDVEDALPARTDKNFFVSMTHEQRKRYAEFEYEAAKLLAILKRRPLTPKEHDHLQILLGCMRMTCDTPYILDPECRDCPKLEELENVLDEVLSEEDAKVIIFSEWVRMLELVKELLTAKGVGYAEHTGSIPQQKRRGEINRFKNDPACRVFVSSESGGSGLNLQVARIVINLDLPWNPAKLEQRIARAWRKHQKHSVRVINLVTENSIEQNMLDKLAYKSALANSVLDGAAFEPPAKSASGRQAFAERVGALLGGDVQPARPTAPDGAPRVAEPETLLATRYADAVLGIERHERSGATLIVARPGADIVELRAQIGGEAEVLTPETKALLLRLQEKGLITLAPELAPVHVGDGYTPMGAASPKGPLLHKDKGAKVWKSAPSECQAARTLAELGLVEQALLHMTTAVRIGGDALMALYGVALGDALPENAAATHRALFQDARSFCNADATGADHLKRGIDLLDELDQALK